MSVTQDSLVSIVVPVLNERENVAELAEGIAEAMGTAGMAFELIVVDDGSSDGTIEVLCQLQASRDYLRVIQFRRNFGQTAALAAGFDHARGSVVVPLDGDLQNDPADIPAVVRKLDEGFDVVSGWRRDRKDNLLSRKIPSWIANYLIGKITGVRLHDYGCTLKAYRKEVLDHINLYGEMHRFIPALASWSGATVGEMEVNHRRRIHGKGKYGLTRTVKVILDLFTVKFLGTFSTKPSHMFGGIGMLSLLGSFLAGLAVVVLKLAYDFNMNRNPLLWIMVMLMIMGVQFLLMGLLAEMMARTYHESQNKPTYIIRNLFEPGSADAAAGPKADHG